MISERTLKIFLEFALKFAVFLVIGILTSLIVKEEKK